MSFIRLTHGKRQYKNIKYTTMKPTIYKTTIVALLLFFIPFMPTSQAQQTKKELVGVLINHQFYSKDMPFKTKRLSKA